MEKSKSEIYSQLNESHLCLFESTCLLTLELKLADNTKDKGKFYWQNACQAGCHFPDVVKISIKRAQSRSGKCHTQIKCHYT